MHVRTKRDSRESDHLSAPAELSRACGLKYDASKKATPRENDSPSFPEDNESLSEARRAKTTVSDFHSRAYGMVLSRILKVLARRKNRRALSLSSPTVVGKRTIPRGREGVRESGCRIGHIGCADFAQSASTQHRLARLLFTGYSARRLTVERRRTMALARRQTGGKKESFD